MRNQSLLNLFNYKQFSTQLLNFVPKHSPVLDSDVRVLRDFINKSDKIALLTGAGISTESGKYILLHPGPLSCTKRLL